MIPSIQPSPTHRVPTKRHVIMVDGMTNLDLGGAIHLPHDQPSRQSPPLPAHLVPTPPTTPHTILPLHSHIPHRPPLRTHQATTAPLHKTIPLIPPSHPLPLPLPHIPLDQAWVYLRLLLPTLPPRQALRWARTNPCTVIRHTPMRNMQRRRRSTQRRRTRRRRSGTTRGSTHRSCRVTNRECTQAQSGSSKRSSATSAALHFPIAVTSR